MTRPRDRLGRPLSADADPACAVPSVPDRPSITAEQAWAQAMDYLCQDLPFHAHEVLEQRWRCCPAKERSAWQGLAQWAAALTHRARGNQVGAHRVAVRALARLQESPCPAPVDDALVRASLHELISGSDASASPPDQRV